MEESIRSVLQSETKLSEQVLLRTFNKLTDPSFSVKFSDLYVVCAERLLELGPPYQKLITDKAELLIGIFFRLNEPLSQYQIRAQICQAIITNRKAIVQRGTTATELNLLAIDFLTRAMKTISSGTLYKPLGLRSAFVYYQIAQPFFTEELRKHLSESAPISIQILEPHVTAVFDSVMRLYISLSLLYGVVLDDAGKSEESTKIIQKVFTLIPQDNIQLTFGLLKLLTHFSRKNSSGLQKMKFGLNEQLQKAVVLYQSCRSNNATNGKDLQEALKICMTYLDTKKRNK